MAVITYKCINCDGPLTYDGSRQRYVCDYCGSQFTEEELAAFTPASAETASDAASDGDHMGGMAEEGKNQAGAAAAGAGADGSSGGTAAREAETAASGAAAAEDAEPGNKGAENAVLYNCPSCGAQIMTDSTTAASICFYCHNPIILTDKLKGLKTPDCVLPFEIDREKAERIFEEWIAKHKYIPEDFIETGKTELTGVYFPYWIYDSDVKSSAVGEGQQVRTYRAGDMQVTETDIFRLSGQGTLHVKNVTRIALTKASKVLCENAAPFDLTKARPFSMGYLQGYVAEVQDVSKDSLAEEMREEIKNSALGAVQSEISAGMMGTRFASGTAQIEKENWKYALLPVYTVTFKERGSQKLYYFSINGQSGRTCGELPTDKSKTRKLFIKTAVAVAAVLCALFYFL